MSYPILFGNMAGQGSLDGLTLASAAPSAQYLYDNGGIYTQKLKCNPEIFIKKNEMVIYDIHYFSCVKHSPTLKRILDELGSAPNTRTILDVFNKHTTGKHLFRFNHSFSLLM